jgi:hypothetical protein
LFALAQCKPEHAKNRIAANELRYTGLSAEGRLIGLRAFEIAVLTEDGLEPVKAWPGSAEIEQAERHSDLAT